MFNKDLIPILRKMMPKTIAQEIVGVQPMPAAMGQMFPRKKIFENYRILPNQNECVLYDTPECTHYAVDVKPEVEEWVKEQPVHMWKYAEETDDCYLPYTRIIVSEELLSWMTLKWT